MSGDENLRIEIGELRRAVGRVLEHVEEQHGSEVVIPADYFWSIPSPEIYDVSASPDMTIGQLSESWDNVKKEREGNGDDTISFALVWLGDVLKAIGHHAGGDG